MAKTSSQKIGVEVDRNLERVGLRAHGNRLSSAFRNEVVTECLGEVYSEFKESKWDEPDLDYRTQNDIVTDAGHRADKLKAQFRGKDGFDFWPNDPCFNDGFGSLAQLGLLECNLHFGGQYRIGPDEEFTPWVAENADLANCEAPLPPRKEENPYLHYRAVRHGWTALSLSKPQQFKQYENEIPGCYNQQKPTEVNIAATLEKDLNIWIEDLSFDRKFHGTSKVEYSLDLGVHSVDETPIKKLDKNGLSRLLGDLDLHVIWALAEVAKPVFEEEASLECECNSGSQHLGRSVVSDLNTGIHTPVSTEEAPLSDEFDQGDISCVKAKSDVLERTRFESLSDAGLLEVTYSSEIHADFDAPGGRY